ncbi:MULTISPECIES: phosphoglucomutase/phosphomannomutase family protein [Prochlorococcus]|uniref:Phosphoglucosamine mutase n=1 Tax=Prochlorococcus marinus str. MIT 9116 TaxID=167544 RepID=A0A0A1ZMY6_PROMR|nr:phosphoglucomutase/phosphomannomutase family protein [Prochlorococcus marinus]KGF89129.1 Phosphoglucosamine mutase [Prochlorococcus marinus str. MIT 9107]KGF89886.1 Phosphoglucosamine mutase [Prochlorococcus marinus str. MIT 9116]KGF95216.1 Phosphoglucosamine mutase [Prochlorococcus marinus str. MIT 9123]
MLAETLNKIKFGTDGWRGIIGFDFNLFNLSRVVVAACQELHYQYYKKVNSKKILIGYDRRFMASEFAKQIVPFVKGCGFEPILSNSFVTTPSCSFYAKEMRYLGALVITASHNPYNWLGLKIKSFNGCSVDESFTSEIEKRLTLGNPIDKIEASYELADVKKFHLDRIKSLFDIEFIANELKKMKMRIFVDPMHGSAAKCITEIFGSNDLGVVSEIRKDADPLFGGTPPEPLLNYLDDLKETLMKNSKNEVKTLGIIFDGDGDRIAAIDEKGRYCSTQDLLPYFISYLGEINDSSYPVLKTVSGSDIIKNISESQNRDVFELPVGFKYIAEKMIKEKIFIGGEESGGVGFGDFMPERDALYAAMILLNGIAKKSQYLCETLDQIQKDFGPSFYKRIDINFPNQLEKNYVKEFIINNIPEKINNHKIINISKIDGIKLRINKNFWLLFRFSGTEPLLRLYCESPKESYLDEVLEWGQKFINLARK